jgi:uncharacterized phiE125 gp8 family phage protein
MTISYADLAELFPIEDVRRQLRIDDDTEDTLLEQFVAVAAEAVESETGHLFTARTVTESFTCFDDVRLRSWPINAVTAIDYFDTAGAGQVIAADQVRIAAGRRPARLVTLGTPFPATSRTIDGVTVTLDAGYANAEDVPMRLRHAVLVMAADMHAQRESFVNGSISVEAKVSLTVDRLLHRFRIATL